MLALRPFPKLPSMLPDVLSGNFKKKKIHKKNQAGEMGLKKPNIWGLTFKAGGFFFFFYYNIRENKISILLFLLLNFSYSFLKLLFLIQSHRYFKSKIFYVFLD
jgi:hypothetical protein